MSKEETNELIYDNYNALAFGWSPTDKSGFPGAQIDQLVKEAYAISLAKVKDQTQLMRGKTIVKSISEKKRVKTGKTRPEQSIS